MHSTHTFIYTANATPYTLNVQLGGRMCVKLRSSMRVSNRHTKDLCAAGRSVSGVSAFLKNTGRGISANVVYESFGQSRTGLWGTCPDYMKGKIWSQCWRSLNIMTPWSRKLHMQKLGVVRSLPRRTFSSPRSSWVVSITWGCPQGRCPVTYEPKTYKSLTKLWSDTVHRVWTFTTVSWHWEGDNECVLSKFWSPPQIYCFGLEWSGHRISDNTILFVIRNKEKLLPNSLVTSKWWKSSRVSWSETRV